MGISIFSKVAPHDVCTDKKLSILDPSNKSSISRANFHFLQKIAITGHNQQQTIWLAENIRFPQQKFLIKQIDKLILYDNNRIPIALKEFELWLQAYKESDAAVLFFAELYFAFQDYQYLYMVYEMVEGYTLDCVLKNHLFTEEETKYVVAVMLQIIQFFHQKNHAMTQLSPQHFIVEKKTGMLKLMQIFNPLPLDVPYDYNIITQPSVYSSPQVLAKNKVLAESDYYSLGTVMYEMMTQKNVVLEELSKLQVIERHHIIKQEFELRKYNLPQGWNPQAADFLVKLLIKNPLYRLGRYGSFERNLRFHPWMQNYNWDILPTRLGITLNQPYFKRPQVKTFPTPPILKLHSQLSQIGILKQPLFIKMFQNYHYRLQFQQEQSTLKKQQKDEGKSTQKIYIKKSQKYYQNENEVSSSQQSAQNSQEEEDYDNLGMSEEKSMEQMGIGKGKKGRGLLNIIGKGDQ